MTEKNGHSESQQFPPISPDAVTRLYALRTALWSAESYAEIAQVALDYHLPPVDPTAGITKSLKKSLFNHYYGEHFPTSITQGEHQRKLDVQLTQLVEHLALHQSEMLLWVFGSYAKGKINGTHSDLDFIAGLPKFDDPEQINNELERIKRMKDIGIVFSEELGPIDNLRHVMESGSGLARLYGMTQSGLEVEFHVLGIEDLQNMFKLRPGHVQRVQPTQPKMEALVSFTGEKRYLPKSAQRVDHYVRTEGSTFKGFFVDNVTATGELVYDPHGLGNQIQQDGWKALLKGYLYHNGAYVGSPQNGAIDLSRISFEGFLQTMHYGKSEDYSGPKLEKMKRMYLSTLAFLAKQFNMPLING